MNLLTYRPPPMNSNPTLRQRLRYRFDNTMSKGTPALVAWFRTGDARSGGDLRRAGRGDPRSARSATRVNVGFWRQLFNTLVHAFDSSAFGSDPGGWPFVLSMIGGDDRRDLHPQCSDRCDLGRVRRSPPGSCARAGRSSSSGHTLILGWSEAVFTIISGLAIAKESESHPVIVVMADRDKVEMEDAIGPRSAGPGRPGWYVVAEFASTSPISTSLTPRRPFDHRAR